MVVAVEDGDRRAGLGEPVGVDERDMGKELQRMLDHRYRHSTAPVREMA